MLLKITTQCSMGCTHCMEDAQPKGEFMSRETFDKAIFFIENTYRNLKMVMISGGEPTEHPGLLSFLRSLEGWNIVVLSNGLFLQDESRKKFSEELLSLVTGLQIYNDDRYYPIKVTPPQHPKIVFGDRINLMSPFGRAVTNGIKSSRQSPACFNLRSTAQFMKNLAEAVYSLRLNGKMCTPSIDVEGNVRAGESRFCYKIGTVESPEDVLLKNLIHMNCNKCGLEDNLSDELKSIIHKGYHR